MAGKASSILLAYCHLKNCWRYSLYVCDLRGWSCFHFGLVGCGVITSLCASYNFLVMVEGGFRLYYSFRYHVILSSFLGCFIFNYAEKFNTLRDSSIISKDIGWLHSLLETCDLLNFRYECTDCDFAV